MRNLKKIEEEIQFYISEALILEDENLREAFFDLLSGLECIKGWDLENANKLDISRSDFEDCIFSDYDSSDLIEESEFFDDLRDLQHEVVSFFDDFIS